MAAGRLWLIVALSVFGWVTGFAPARAADEHAPAASTAPADDILILAVKPEHGGKSYRLIPVGETKIDQGAYRAVVDSLPSGLFGLYKIAHNEQAEAAQCSAACSTHKGCDTSTYVPPDADRGVGVCHLRRNIVDLALIAMTPVVEHTDTKPTVRNSDILISDNGKQGRAMYSAEAAPIGPATFTFKRPVVSATAVLRAQAGLARRMWVAVEAFNARGKRIKRGGTWIDTGDQAHEVQLEATKDAIVTLKLSAREAGTFMVESIDYTREAAAPAEPIAPATVAENENAAPAEETIPIAADEAAVATETSVPAAPVGEQVAQADAAPPGPEHSIIYVHPSPSAAPALPIALPEHWLGTLNGDGETLVATAGIGTLALIIGAFGVRRSGRRKRLLARLTTKVVTNGLDRQTFSVETGEIPELSLRFAMRRTAAVGARDTSITIVPEGAAA